MYVPFLDYLINELFSRFEKSQMVQIGQIKKTFQNQNFGKIMKDHVRLGGRAELYKDDLLFF